VDTTEATDVGAVFNLHFAPALEYPGYYGMQPFSRIPVGQEKALERFCNRLPPEWPIPLRRKVSEYVSILCLIIAVGLICKGLRQNGKSYAQK